MGGPAQLFHKALGYHSGAWQCPLKPRTAESGIVQLQLPLSACRSCRRRFRRIAKPS